MSAMQTGKGQRQQQAPEAVESGMRTRTAPALAGVCDPGGWE